MTEQHERPLALLRDMHADAVRFDRTMRDLAHVSSPSGGMTIYYMRLWLCIADLADAGPHSTGCAAGALANAAMARKIFRRSRRR